MDDEVQRDRLQYSLRHRGEIVPIHEFPGYQSHSARAPFPAERIRAQCGAEWLQLDRAEAERLASSLLGQ